MIPISDNEKGMYYQLVFGKEGNVEPLSQRALVNDMTMITFPERNWSDGFQDPVEALMLDKTHNERKAFLFKQEMSYRWDHQTDSRFKRRGHSSNNY